MKNLLYIIIPAIFVGAAITLFSRTPGATDLGTLQASVMQQDVVAREKVYVALEEEGVIAIIDPSVRTVTRRIDLTEEANGMTTQYMPHNIQVAPDGKTIWVAANVMEGDMGNTHDMGKSDPTARDQAIVIDPASDRIITRIPIGSESHLAHVVVTPDNAAAYVTSQEKGEVYKINAKTYTIENTIALGKNSGPHGLRISPDGTTAYIALTTGKALAVLDIKTNEISRYPAQSKAVQTAATSDGKYAFTSLYDAKQILRLDISSGKTTTIDLPKEAKGPVQIYPTPDSRFLYIADQGYYFDQPTSTNVYRIDIEKSAIDQTIPAGTAPHGIVVDKQGRFAYITNLLSNDVSVIDTAQGKEIARVPVGTMPNGISVWNSALGGTQ